MPDPHVTIPDEVPLVQYSVSSTPDDEFAIPFSFFDTTDIKVYNGNSLVSSDDYTITGTAGTTGGYEGGTLTLDSAVTSTTITILRDVPAARTTDFPLSGPFNITSLNTQLDKLFAIQQQQNRIIDNAITIPDTDDSSITTELPVAASRANKALVFDASGNIDVSTDDYDDQATNAAASATAAAASATAAATSATNAATSETNAAASAASASATYDDVLTAVDGFTGDLVVDVFSGDDMETAFTLSEAPSSENNTWVYISGVYQQKDTYSIASTTLTFSSAPPTGTDNIEVVIGKALPIATPGNGTVGNAQLSETAITGQTDTAIAVGDSILFSDASDSDSLKKDTVQGIVDLTIGPALADPGADRLYGWDDSETAMGFFTLGAGLGFSGTGLTHTGVIGANATFKTDTFTMSDSSYADITGLSVSYTPKSASSTIYVLAMVSGAVNTATDVNGFLRILRDSTALQLGASASSRTRVNTTIPRLAGSSSMGNAILIASDTPGDTSAHTYKVQCAASNNGDVYINRSDDDSNTGDRPRGVSAILVLEVL